MDIEAKEKGWILKGQQTDQDPTYMKIAQVCPLYEYVLYTKVAHHDFTAALSVSCHI
jgi:hypothetical protein